MENNSLKIQAAVAFATEAHSGQTRKGTSIPYIVHPLEVLDIVSSLTEDEDVLCAAVLHDVVEDTPHTAQEILENFGERVAALVCAESENKRPDLPEKDTWRIRKEETIAHLKTASHDVLLICLGDKLANLRAICKDYAAIGDKLWERFNASPKQIAWYYRSVMEVLEPHFYNTDAWQELFELCNSEAFDVYSAADKAADDLLQVFAEDVKQFSAEGNSCRFSKVLSDLLTMLENDISVTTPASFDASADAALAIQPVALSDDYDNDYLVIQTEEDEHFPFTMKLKIRKLFATIKEDESLSGIIINPFTDEIVIPREFADAAVSLFGAGYIAAKEYIRDAEKEHEEQESGISGVSYSIDTPLPMPEENFASIPVILDALRDLPYEHLTVSFRNHRRNDPVIYMQAARNTCNEKLYHVEVAFDMSDFNWQHPLILGKDDMTLSEASDLFHEICVNCTQTDQIPVIQEFKDMGFGKETEA